MEFVARGVVASCVVGACGLPMAVGQVSGGSDVVVGGAGDGVSAAEIMEIQRRALDGRVVALETLATPANRAQLSRARVVSLVDRSVVGAGLEAVDGDGSSVVTVSGDRALELDFIGAARWIDRVTVDADGEVSVSYLGLDGEWRLVEPGRDGGVEAIRASALRVSAVRGEVDVAGVFAGFDQVDPDDAGEVGRASGPEYFYEWCEDYATSPLFVCQEETEGLGDRLDGNWVVRGFGNQLAWENDFKRSSLGGAENSYVDAADLSYFAGHGSAANDETWGRVNRSLNFSRTDRDDAHHLPGDSLDSWGDLDMEWMGFAACQLMRDDNYWAASMDGIHLIMGWETNMRDVTMGIDFARRANGTSIFDPARRVLDSWFWAAERNHGNGYTALVVGENSAMGNDFLWGEGFVNPDPVDDTTYTWWKLDTSSARSEIAGVDTSMPAAVHEPRAAVEGDVVVFEGRGENAVRVTIARDVMEEAQRLGRDTLFRFETLNYGLNDIPGDMFDVASADLCQQLGAFCDGDAGVSGDGTQFGGADGPFVLQYDIATRASSFVNEFLFLNGDVQGEIPTPGEAVNIAQQFLGANPMLLFSDGGDAGNDFGVQDVRTFVIADEGKAGGEMENVREIRPLHQRVLLRRTIGGVPVFGPGGEASVDVGVDGQVVAAARNTWQRADIVEEVGLNDIQAYLQLLADNPQQVAVDGVQIIAESIQVDEVMMGYYASGEGDGSLFIRPAYLLLTTVTEQADVEVPPSALEINVFADTFPIEIEIDGPGGCVNVGDEVCFAVTDVANAVGEVSFQWAFSTGGAAQGGPQACFTVDEIQDPGDSSPDQEGREADKNGEDGVSRTVSVTVTDELGNSATASLTVEICDDVVCPGDTNGDGAVTPLDISTVLSNFGSSNASGPADGDVTGDGLVTALDISLVLSNFGSTCP